MAPAFALALCSGAARKGEGVRLLVLDCGAQEHRFSLKPFEMVVKIFTIEVWRRRVLRDAGLRESLLRRSTC